MMRLLNTVSHHLEDFQSEKVPQYAILSHRWQDDEISLQELQQRSNEHKAGWNKVRRCCTLARGEGYDYVWIDTCCIDKTSSAELQEAINSMFRWYRNADICYVYLSDFSGSLNLVEREGGYFPHAVQPKLEKSKWFTRGWTLQELLAPRELCFIREDWTVLDSRLRLSESISAITGIPKLYVTQFEGSTVAHAEDSAQGLTQMPSIAQIMSWASRRVTTRAEDMAYSLMGLFGVQMPLLYGEGRKAFLRLQLEIIKMTDDESIFAWRRDGSCSGLLAPSPRCFEGSKYTVPFESAEFDSDRPPFAMTNKGLRIEPMLRQVDDGIYLMPLNCSLFKRGGSCMAIYLERESSYDPSKPESSFGNKSQFSRVQFDNLDIVSHNLTGDTSNFERHLVYVREDYTLY